MRCENCGAHPSSDDLERGECVYCGRALRPQAAPPAFVAPPPLVHVAPHPARSAPGNTNGILLGVAAGILFVAGLLAFSVTSGGARSSVPGAAVVSTSQLASPSVPPAPSYRVEPVPRPVARATPPPLAPAASTTGRPGAGPARGSRPGGYVPVTVSLVRFDSTMVQGASLVAFVAPVRACFTKSNSSAGITLQFSLDGRLNAATLGEADGAPPSDCVRAKLDGLHGGTPAGYVGGRASTATLKIGS